MTLPNFLILGAAKGGTTALYHYLKQHPEIFMPSLKEPNFFALEGKEINFKGPQDEGVNKDSINNMQDYRGLFSGVQDEKAIGEASPLYLYSQYAPENIKSYIPNAKLIAILRNPVDRAFSSYLHCCRDKREPYPKDFGKALSEEKSRIEANWGLIWHYKSAGYYYEQLKRYYEIFNNDQIKVILYDDFIDNPISVYREVLKFLEVNDSFIPNMKTRYNVSGVPKNHFIHDLMINKNLFKSTLKKLIPNKKLRYNIRAKIYNNNLKKPKVENKFERELIQEYREDINKLENMININLNNWYS
ncbi:sulfotransferase family protein [Tuberibacillus sp. Marseille-P3662]|uniref:sulfotransferase family protein n=1 Tax=Tuberibacillus sp. Marseille-P3662 TaxID=1965358 RepID=UPI000A1C9263|nr:sulfotransferase [Tuberibacillus sp. Marseille-P3662]